MKIRSPHSVLIVVDNLRIGGIERNALDQMYQLADQGTSSTLVIMNEQSTKEHVNFFSTEGKMIESKCLDIRFSPRDFLEQFRFFRSIVREKSVTLVIDYTLARTPLLRAACFLTGNRASVNCVIQQFPSMSSRTQQMKRMFYSQFSSKLFFNSINYSDDWDALKSKLIYKLFFRKKFGIIRNGVYLGRINSATEINPKAKEEEIRFVFLGRLKYWKGLENLKKIDDALEQRCRFLIMTPEPDKEVVNKFFEYFGTRVEFEFGKTLTDFRPLKSDIHIYPVDYGLVSRFVESVSTNCLEMSLIGVPSLVTRGGTRNWPELKELDLVIEVDWEDAGNIRKSTFLAKRVSVNSSQMEVIRTNIGISSNLSKHLL